MSKWIPCNERLPETDGDLLVTYEKGYAEENGFKRIARGSEVKADKEG